MAKNKDNLPLQKHTLHLFEGDFDRLAELYDEVSPSIVIRKIVRAHINQVEKPINVSEHVEVDTSHL